MEKLVCKETENLCYQDQHPTRGYNILAVPSPAQVSSDDFNSLRIPKPEYPNQTASNFLAHRDCERLKHVKYWQLWSPTQDLYKSGWSTV